MILLYFTCAYIIGNTNIIKDSDVHQKGLLVFIVGIILPAFAHLALKAEDGDTQTHCGSDANAQHYRLGVVETGRSRKRYCYIQQKLNILWNCLGKHAHTTDVSLPRDKTQHASHAQSLCLQDVERSMENK